MLALPVVIGAPSGAVRAVTPTTKRRSAQDFQVRAGVLSRPGTRWTNLQHWSTLVREKRVDEATRADPGSLARNPRDRCAGIGPGHADAIRWIRRSRIPWLHGRTLRGRPRFRSSDRPAICSPAIFRKAIRSIRLRPAGARRLLRRVVAVLRLSVRLPAALRGLPRRVRFAGRFTDGSRSTATAVYGVRGAGDSARPVAADARGRRVLDRPVSASRRWRRHGVLMGVDPESTDRAPG